MATPPNYVRSSARALNGKVRVELGAPPVAFGLGFILLAPDVADELGDQLKAAARAARGETPTSEQSAEHRSGG